MLAAIVLLSEDVWSTMTKHNAISDYTTEAEYKELAKTSKSAKFILMLQEELRMADSPSIIFCDNSHPTIYQMSGIDVSILH